MGVVLVLSVRPLYFSATGLSIEMAETADAGWLLLGGTPVWIAGRRGTP